jgi:hypothetical protein
MIHGTPCGKDWKSSITVTDDVPLLCSPWRSAQKGNSCLSISFHLQSQSLNLIIFSSWLDKFRSGKSIVWQSFVPGTSRIQVYSVTTKVVKET